MFEQGSWPTLPVLGSTERAGVRRILCIGKNYVAHVRELGGDERFDPPVHFLKSPTALLAAPGPVEMPYPPRTADLHHEIELCLVLTRGGRNIAPDDALDLVGGYAVGLDMTRRDLQGLAKKGGRPWAAAKDFDHSAIVGPVVPAAQIGHPDTGRIWLEVNGETRQDGDLSHMIWPVPGILAELSSLMTLLPGDLVFTGTPAGVGPVVPGDRISGHIAGLPSLDVTIVAS